MNDQLTSFEALTASLAERIILAFEQNWRAASPPSISAAVDGCDLSARRALAQELAAIDMEFRWQASAQGEVFSVPPGGQPTWHDYVNHVPDIGDVDGIPPALIAEEYRIRQLWGDRPSHDRFISRFPYQLTHVPKLLSQVDDELRADGVDCAESSPPTLELPTAFDPRAPLPWSDYLLQEHLGSGGFGKVYRATQKSLDRRVAVKALHKARQRDPQAVEQFIHEARLLARLRHPGIVGVHGLARFPGGGYFLVLDLVEGEDLQRRIDRGPLPLAEAVRITIAAAEAIQHAHEYGVLHGDLKPSNVLVDSRGTVTVTDFGLGQLLTTASTDLSTLHRHGGTVAYIAPEVVRGGPVGIPVDVYGLGAVLFALLTGRPPRHAESSTGMYREAMSELNPPAPSTFRDNVAPHLDAVVMQCLASDAETRFLSAGDVATALSECSSI